MYIILHGLQCKWVKRIMILIEVQYQETKTCPLFGWFYREYFFFFHIPLKICFYFLKRVTFICVFVLGLFVITVIPGCFFLPDSIKELLLFYKKLVSLYKHSRDISVVIDSMDFESYICFHVINPNTKLQLPPKWDEMDLNWIVEKNTTVLFVTAGQLRSTEAMGMCWKLGYFHKVIMKLTRGIASRKFQRPSMEHGCFSRTKVAIFYISTAQHSKIHFLKGTFRTLTQIICYKFWMIIF